MSVFPTSVSPASLPGGEDHQCAVDWIAAGAKRLFIGGKWVAAQSGRTFESISPVTEECLAIVAEADVPDVDAAVIAARQAFEDSAWSRMNPHVRSRALLKIADAIERHAGELAVLESLDVGMPIWYSTASVAAAVQVFHYYAGWPTKMFGTTNPTDPTTFIYTLREPLGVCGQINPWNAPFIMASIKIATALSCGNTVLLKPAEQAPLSTLRLAELIQSTELPAGVVNIIPGFGPTAGAAIAAHPAIDKVAFTGSTVVGKQILAASVGNLKKVTLELGGKSPNIIFPDADVEKALQSAVKSFCGNSGQVCSAGTRLFVHESLHEEVSDRVTRLAATYKVGLPFETDTKLGPLISGKQLDRVMGYIESGKRAGASLRLGGSRVSEKGYFVEPTVFSGVANSMSIAQEEIFGPVLSIIPFRDEHDAVFQANDTQYGLAAAVWTRDNARAHTVARRLKAGRVWINTYGEADPVMAFGGYKQSGIGREYGAESIDAYTQSKAVMMRL